MISNLKARLYFVAAGYFRFWARISLERWQPRVIVITGSSGKTTLLHMLESQLPKEAKVSHHANSAFGIPFDLLGLSGIEGSRLKWLSLILLAPFRAFLYEVDKPIYLAEVDAERPGEAPFLADLLRPDVTLWVSSARTHAVYYDKLIKQGEFDSVEEAVANEYAYVCKKTSDLVVFDADNQNMSESIEDISAKKIGLKQKEDLERYKLSQESTEFELKTGEVYVIPQLQPKNVFYQVAMLNQTMSYLDKTPDYDFDQYTPPPGRSNVFKGKKGITIIDSTYNTNLSSLTAVVSMFAEYPAEPKWAVIGDMVEEGDREEEQHQKLAESVAKIKAQKYILLGPRVIKSTAPKLKKLTDVDVVGFENPKDVLDYLEDNLKGGETVLFKGARFLEGVIEHLLADKSDTEKLARRGDVWQKRREKWGL